jgi:hypothetical protein
MLGTTLGTTLWTVAPVCVARSKQQRSCATSNTLSHATRGSGYPTKVEQYLVPVCLEIIDADPTMKDRCPVDLTLPGRFQVGAKFYGAFWCSHCYDQKVQFGAQAAELLPYVECFPDGYRCVRALHRHTVDAFKDRPFCPLALCDSD